MNIFKKIRCFFMSSEPSRQEADCELWDKLSNCLKNDESAIQRWEEQNLLISPIFQHKLWNSAFFLFENGYRLDTPAYLNTPMRQKALATLWMDDKTYYAMLSVSTPALLNYQDKEGNTLLHAMDDFYYHMELRDADTILTRITDMVEQGANITIKNKNGDLPFKKISPYVGCAKNASVRRQFLKILQQQREYTKA